jgi:hypothetical protein
MQSKLANIIGKPPASLVLSCLSISSFVSYLKYWVPKISLTTFTNLFNASIVVLSLFNNAHQLH